MSFITPIISEVNTLTKTVRLVYAFLLTLYKLLSCNSVSPPAQCLQDVLIWMADSTFFKCLPRKMRINPRLWEMTNLKQVWRTISSKGYFGLWLFFFFPISFRLFLFTWQDNKNAYISLIFFYIFFYDMLFACPFKSPLVRNFFMTPFIFGSLKFRCWNPRQHVFNELLWLPHLLY